MNGNQLVFQVLESLEPHSITILDKTCNNPITVKALRLLFSRLFSEISRLVLLELSSCVSFLSDQILFRHSNLSFITAYWFDGLFDGYRFSYTHTRRSALNSTE